MKKAFLLLAALLLSPAIARADLVYKCKAVKFSDGKTANLRFGEFGRSGSIEVEYWNGYPPINLITADLRAPVTKDGMAVFQSETDPHGGYRATVEVPATFLRQDFFEARITLLKSGKEQATQFACNRF